MFDNSTAVSVQPVVSKADWRQFFGFADRVQRQDPQWIAPLALERRKQWSAQSPWFAHGEARAWLARRGAEVVGTISAQIDRLHEQTWGDKVGYFGQLEAWDDADIFTALLTTASDWLRNQGVSVIRGPYDLSPNQSCGLLIEGFEHPPMIMMGHAPPYYARQLSAAGLHKAVDLVAFWGPTSVPPPERVQKLLHRYRNRLQVRGPRRDDFAGELERMRVLFNDAWANNWGFVPFTVAEFTQLGKDMKPLLKPWSIQIAEWDGQPAAFMVTLPNLNEAITDLHGKLLPFGWAKLAWRLLRGRFDSARVPLMGVRSDLQGGTVGAALAYAMVDRTRRALQADGINTVELSWILEHNTGVQSIIESMGPRIYKRYRIYERSLQQDPE